MAGLYMSSSSLAARAGTNHSFCYSSLDKLEMYAKAVVPPCHRLNHIKATDAQTDFVGSIGRRSPIDYTSISFQTSSLSLLLQPCHQRTPPFPRPKIWRNCPTLHFEIYQNFLYYILQNFCCLLLLHLFWRLSSSCFMHQRNRHTNGLRRLHRSSVSHWLHFYLTSNIFPITAIATLPSKHNPLPFQDQKFEEMALLYILKFIRIFSTIFYKIFLVASTSLLTFSFLRHGSKRPTHKRTFFVPSVVGLPLTTLLFHFKPLLYHCFNILNIKGPPLSKTKNLKKLPYFTFWNLSEFSLLYFITVDFASLFSLYVYLAYCCLIFCLRTFFFDNLTECYTVFYF